MKVIISVKELFIVFLAGLVLGCALGIRGADVLSALWAVIAVISGG